MADRHVKLSALIAKRMGLKEGATAVWVSPRRAARRGPGGALIPSDQEFGMTADVVVDDPREPRIEATGIYDARGQMLCRVYMPVKAKMGFNFPCYPQHDEFPTEITSVVPEDMLSSTDVPGMGMGYIDVGDVEEFEDSEQDD
jgi:hypothetical protein